MNIDRDKFIGMAILVSREVNITKTVLVSKHLRGPCTFIGSVVSLLTGIEKKAWLISHFRDRADQRLSWLLALCSAP